MRLQAVLPLASASISPLCGTIGVYAQQAHPPARTLESAPGDSMRRLRPAFNDLPRFEAQGARKRKRF